MILGVNPTRSLSFTALSEPFFTVIGICRALPPVKILTKLFFKFANFRQFDARYLIGYGDYLLVKTLNSQCNKFCKYSQKLSSREYFQTYRIPKEGDTNVTYFFQIFLNENVIQIKTTTVQLVLSNRPRETLKSLA